MLHRHWDFPVPIAVTAGLTCAALALASVYGYTSPNGRHGHDQEGPMSASAVPITSGTQDEENEAMSREKGDPHAHSSSPAVDTFLLPSSTKDNTPRWNPLLDRPRHAHIPRTLKEKEAFLEGCGYNQDQVVARINHVVELLKVGYDYPYDYCGNCTQAFFDWTRESIQEKLRADQIERGEVVEAEEVRMTWQERSAANLRRRAELAYHDDHVNYH